MKPTNLRLQEFRDRDEFEIGVNITDDEISEMAKELLDFQEENKNLGQTIDIQHEITISDLKLIGKLQQENGELIKNAKSLYIIAKAGAPDDWYKSAFKVHEILMQKYNNKTT